MEKLFDKLLLLCLCLWFAFSQGMPDTAVIALLTAAIVSALCSYLSGRTLSVLPVVYTAAALFWLPLLLFLPLIAYDLMILRPRPMRLLWLAAVLPY